MADETKTLKGGITKDEPTAEVFTDDAVYYFDIINEHSLQLENQITDNWVENNTAVQDHIAHSPITISLRGLIGEVVIVPNEKTEAELLERAKLESNKQNTIDKLTSITSIVPIVDNYTQLAMNAYDYVNASYNRYKSIYDRFTIAGANQNTPMDTYFGIKGSEKTEPKLQKIYRKLSVKRANNSSFIVKTPWAEFQNMYIQSLVFRQGEENYVSDIEVTFKQINFSNVTVTNPDKNVMAQYNAHSRAQEQNGGLAQGRKSIAATLWDSGSIKDSLGI